MFTPFPLLTFLVLTSIAAIGALLIRRSSGQTQPYHYQLYLIFLLLASVWAVFYEGSKKSALTPQINPPTHSVATPIHQEPEPQDGWAHYSSEEGGFSVLSPLPFTTQVSVHEVQGFPLKITITRFRDIQPPLIYAVMTSHYPTLMELPPENQQIQLAVSHLLQEYHLEPPSHLRPISQEGHDGVFFETSSATTQEHFYGLILPVGRTLYQAFTFSPKLTDPQAVDTARNASERFLLSLRPNRSPPQEEMSDPSTMSSR